MEAFYYDKYTIYENEFKLKKKHLQKKIVQYSKKNNQTKINELMLFCWNNFEEYDNIVQLLWLSLTIEISKFIRT
jgi:hypothetical protein